MQKDAYLWIHPTMVSELMSQLSGLNSIVLHMVAKLCKYRSLFSQVRGLFSDYNKILSHIFAQLLNCIAQITLHRNHKPSSRQEFDLLILHSVGTGEVLLSTYKE
jgi:hypothetical protein